MPSSRGDSFPFDHGFYRDLVRNRQAFELLRTLEPAESGYSFRVEAGTAFRFEIVSGPQILDVDLFNADDVSEHYDSGFQFHVEGTFITRFTRIWGTPPRNRPLATVIADSVRWKDNSQSLRDHKSFGGHCHPHHWVLLADRHPRTCYDNLRSGLGMLGLSQRHIHDNLNLFQKLGTDPHTGRHLSAPSDAELGDFIEFYAELPLLVVVSLCPYGDGTVPPDRWRENEIPTRPVRIRIFDTHVPPVPWEYFDSDENG